MSILKKEILLSENDKNIKILFEESIHDCGYDDIVTSYGSDILNNNINPIIDVEIITFKYYSSSPSYIGFNFSGITTYSFENAGFTTTEIEQYESSEVMTNSFYIIDFYTSNTNNKTKISSSYISNIGNSTYYNLSENNQFNKISLPRNYLSGDTVDIFVYFSFFNAKTGNISRFINYKSSIDYFIIELDLSNNTWKFTNPTPTVICKEDIVNTTYNNLVQNTVTTINNQIINYPSSQYFDYRDRSYKDS